MGSFKMQFDGKGVSTLGEFIIIIGVILASVIFLLTFQRTVTQQSNKVKDLNAKEIGERIAGLLNRHSGGPSNVVYSMGVPKVSVEVKDGVLTVKKGGNVFSEAVPGNTKDAFLNNTYKVVVLKRGDQIALRKGNLECNFNFFCEPKECFSDCGDCYGPSQTCIGDGNCTKAIGETCKNSPQDCACGSGKECCPGHPDSDEHSCLNITEKKEKGKQCYCDNQCSSGLECSNTTSDFNEFKKGCCPSGKNWNGDSCIDVCDKGPHDRFACNTAPTYNRYLDVCHSTVKSKIKSWIYSDPDLKTQVYNGNYDNAVRKIWEKSYNELYGGSYCAPTCTQDNKPVNKLIDGSVSCGVCNHWAAAGTSLIRTLGVPEDRVYSVAFRNAGGGHAVTAYKSDRGEWWILDYTCCEDLVKAKNWNSCGGCACYKGELIDNDYYSGRWKSSMVGGIC